MKKYRALFLDIDGTIVKPDDTIENSTKRAILDVKNLGIEVILTTGRPIHEIRKLAGELNIQSFIGYNGAAAVIKFIGEERVERAIQFAAKNMVLRYTLMPILSVLLLTNPMAYTFGRFLPEKQKPAFYDSAVSFVHPVTGLFPYANAGELFVYLGIANGIKELGLPVADLAVRYFIVGIVVIFIRGVVTELITKFLAKKIEA